MDYRIADEYVGKTFKKCREDKNLTLVQVSTFLGVPKGTYYYYEIGKRSMPFDLYKKACLFYGLNYEVLFKDAQNALFESIRPKGKK